MALPTFAITHTEVGYYFPSHDLSSEATQINRWVQQISGDLDAVLRNQGTTGAAAEAQGVSSALYLLCQEYIELRCASRVAQGNTRQDPKRSQAFRDEAEEVKSRIVDTLESTLDGYDPDEGRSTPRTLRTTGTPRQASGRRTEAFWRRGRGI